MSQIVIPNEKEMNEQIAEWAAAAGFVGEAGIAEWIKTNAPLHPAARAKDLNLTTEVQQAWLAGAVAAGMLLEDESNPGATLPKNNNGGSAKKGSVKSRPTSTLTAAQEAALQAHILSNIESMSAVSVNSSIPEFCVARPTSEEYIEEGTKGTIKVDSWKAIQDKIASGEYVVVDDFDNSKGERVMSKSNYDILVQAAAAKSETVPVMRNDKVGPAIGYFVVVADTANANGENQLYTKEALQHFVEMKAAGYIKAGADTLGVQLKELTVKSKDPSVADTKKVVLSDTNKKAAVAAKHYRSIRAVQPAKEKKSQKSELVFYVNKKIVNKGQDGKPVVTNDFMTDNKNNVRKFAIRATVECQVHKLEILPEFEGKFPLGKVDPTKPLDGTQLKKVANATVQDLAITLSDRSASLTVDPRLKEALESLKNVIGEQTGTPENVEA